MKIYYSIVTLAVTLIQLANIELSFSQETGLLPKGYTERVLIGVELGELMCEDINGQMVKCSGSIEETILGIVTNVPYVTLNKPANLSDSKHIFKALVTTVANPISRGDYLTLSNNGKLEKASDALKAYAIAMQDTTVDGLISVKVISHSN